MATLNIYEGPCPPECRDHGRVRVQYLSGQHVNLAVERTTDFRETGEPVWNEVDGGLWVGLSRDGINQLIRGLREARDRAYGKDE